MIEGLDGVVNIIEDLLVWGDSIEQYDERLLSLLKRADENGFRFNKAKCKFRVTGVKYTGHRLKADDLRPDDENVRAITQMPTPGKNQALMRVMTLPLTKQNCNTPTQSYWTMGNIKVI